MTQPGAKNGKVRKRVKPPGSGGSRKGIPNKVTQNAREAIAMLVEGFTPEMYEWLREIKEREGVLVAWKCLADVLEYHIPKLSRTELHQEGTMTFIIETGVPEDE